MGKIFEGLLLCNTLIREKQRSVTLGYLNFTFKDKQ